MTKRPRRTPALTYAKRRAIQTEKARKFNKSKPFVPNCSKVVRLIVCPPGFRTKDPNAVRKLADARHATRADAFVVKHKEHWEPMYWLGDGLVTHGEGMLKHIDTVTKLNVEDREQVQWECDVPFRIKSIALHEEHDGIKSVNKLTAHPFRKDVVGEIGGPGRPLISGPPTFKKAFYPQWLKVTFELQLPGSNEWQEVDPDVLCEWP